MIFILRRVAIASAIALAALLLWFRRVENGKAVTRLATAPVVVAVRDIPEGVSIDPTAIVVARWPVGTRPADAYVSAASVAGRVTHVPVYKGEAIVPGRLAPDGTGAGLEVKISPGKRAYGIRIDDVASLAGMVQPNSRVDIMVVMSDPQASTQVAKLFMSNIRVLAIGAAPKRAQDERPINAVASIEVTPEEAERIATAASRGSLQLVLRGWADRASDEPKKPYIPNGLSPDVRRMDPMPRFTGPGALRRSDTLTVRVFRGQARS
jgi:pilus assembly protein CpaB